MKLRVGLVLLLLSTAVVGCSFVESILLPDPKPAPTPKPQPVKPIPAPAFGRDFHVLRDGFAFQNYTRSTSALDLTPANLERLCGRGTCSSGSGNSCVPSGSMRSFLKYANASMGGGHCEGMSVLAQAIHKGHVSLRSLDPYARSTVELPFSPRVQSEIAYWYATQLTSPTKYHQRFSPAQILSELGNENANYTIGFCKTDHTGCHAVSPIKVFQESQNPRINWVNIYDSNFPKDWTRYIRVNSATQQWSYPGYIGDANSGTLFIRPFQNRLVKAQCPTSGDLDDAEEEEEDDDDFDWQVWLNGDGALAVPRNTKWIPRNSDNLDKGILPIYVFKKGEAIRLKILGKNLTGETTDLAFFTRGQSMSIEGIKLDQEETDKVSIGASGDTLNYSTTDKEEISLVLSATYKGADYEIKIRPVPKSGGFDTRIINHAGIKKRQHELSFELKSHDGTLSTFTIEMNRIGGQKDERFTHQKESLSVGANETITFKYGAWLKDGQPMKITRDINSDGKIDQTQSLADDE